MRCCRSIAAPGRSGRSTARSRRRSSGCSSIPSSCSASSAIRRMSRPGRSYRVNDLALASRLSFFLWSSVPDDELLQLAEKGKLKEPAILEQQVRRMIADERSSDARHELRGAVAVPAERQAGEARFVSRSRTGTTTCVRRWSPRPSSSSTIRFAGTTASPNCSRPDYSFLNERLARHYSIRGRVRQPFPPRGVHRRGSPRRPARATGASCWSRRSRTGRRRSCAASGCSRTSSTTRRRRRRRTCPTCRRS